MSCNLVNNESFRWSEQEEEEWSPPQALKIYPNPASRQFQLFFTFDQSTPSTTNISIRDLFGHEVFEQSIPSSLFSVTDVDCSKWQEGIYLITVTCGDKILRDRIVVSPDNYY